MKKNIHLMGLRDDIPEIIAAADIFTLPSYREGLPRSIIEAMAMGKPIIATDIRGCREEVVEGMNGLLCKVKDAKALADSLEVLIINEEKTKNFGIQSRRIFLEEFEEQKVLNRQLNIFNEFRKGKLDV
ncbi:glycosyltransferase [Planococcus antarcticus]|uniref:glycosyltransferase n=1 Tax=Planococcus antarcticus TaxID=161360 RepID=UPI0022AB0143|nr:glycosyltransferase [Planococcus antarcticus]